MDTVESTVDRGLQIVGGALAIFEDQGFTRVAGLHVESALRDVEDVLLDLRDEVERLQAKLEACGG